MPNITHDTFAVGMQLVNLIQALAEDIGAQRYEPAYNRLLNISEKSATMAEMLKKDVLTGPPSSVR